MRKSTLAMVKVCCASMCVAAGSAWGGDEPKLIPYSGCGVLALGPECTHFYGFDGVGFSIGDTGDFQIGEYVQVEGFICPECPSICQDGPVFQTKSIVECDPPMLVFNGCGTLVLGGANSDCLLFQADTGGLYMLWSDGGLSVGDRVHVTSIALAPKGCGTACGEDVDCFLQNTIDPCLVGDVDLDDDVDVDDLFAVIAVWGGACNDGCAEDVDHTGFIDIDDIFTLLANWTTG